MWVIVSEDLCVVRQGNEYFICRRNAAGKLERLYTCKSYQEAYQTYRQISRGVHPASVGH
ncbi:MAG: hypothetical protein RMJ43_06840 [Chloroherpetonaceae bacterium]|nr:hypothetical protein [Chthonomonadaceae bacterium]MDW8207537.1 hypothetical protein [Chloroherpetonaceae bacterium]